MPKRVNRFGQPIESRTFKSEEALRKWVAYIHTNGIPHKGFAKFKRKNGQVTVVSLQGPVYRAQKQGDKFVDVKVKSATTGPHFSGYNPRTKALDENDLVKRVEKVESEGEE